ncbi:hypothetical protein GCWU000182_01342 [Abiotrophia defectiva ATCC 49176]|uniref:Uncharacterized protein n=1 Tax=Abiotrophia defectiva ATCC 49176 TaxID=592010 RepID=W1Q2B6_ABIDE|nr:hypothetical protein GCWU000182_01342 [Abiotrophia defectiva ATCC 49176]
MKKFLLLVLNQICLKLSSTLYFKAFHGTIKESVVECLFGPQKGLERRKSHAI